ncbi:hypothetical protein FA95DRAFT_1515305 [Auriscalpium vulgare]|uniref:Uncharacterized protein n=1 Tax=Auriscalpium vulgare TaxID=40419 RepID=A0ACB8S0M8_9AGAM|nr:hypothetical protein FA95DRAFT_1515305 [Auriscalpium vulgare]
MNDTRRRSVMQSSTTSNARTGIPMPMSTTKKPAQNMRLSMAGAPMRGPYPQQNLQVPGTNPRQSLYRSQNVNPLLASTSKQPYGRTPMKNSTRRGSIWGGPGAAAMPPPASGAPLKDHRPLRDQQYQRKMRQEIHAWLQSTEYDISMQTLANITGKDFRGIFQYLVAMLDPFYPFDSKARFEDEFMPALKSLRYPFVGQLDPKWLAAPASMHSWPSLLGVLHWLVVMCKGRLHYMESGDPTLQFSDNIPEEFDDPNHHQALAFDYYEEAYEVFFSGSDSFEEQQQRLQDRYAKKNERTVVELDEQKSLLAKAQAELEKLLSAPAPIETLRVDNGHLKRDRAKFQECIRSWEARKKTTINNIATLNAEITQQLDNLERLKAERDRLGDIVKEQNLSPEEVIRMNTDHESLSRSLEDLKHKISESHKTIMSLEVAVANRASAAEEALEAYTNLLANLGLFPPLPSPFEDIDLRLELNTAASQPQQLLLGADIRRVIKPSLSAIAESQRNERATVESERIRLDHELDQLLNECELMDEEAEKIAQKYAAVEAQAEEIRDAAQHEAMASNVEIAHLEKDLMNARTAALASGVGVKSRLQALQIAYREQQDKVARLRDETERAILKITNATGEFQKDISQQLQSFKEYVDSN